MEMFRAPIFDHCWVKKSRLHKKFSVVKGIGIICKFTGDDFSISEIKIMNNTYTVNKKK